MLKRLILLPVMVGSLLAVAGEGETSTGTTTRVSVGTQCTNVFCNVHATISASGRYVVFESWAYNLVPNDNNNGGPDVFVRDRELGITEHVSVNNSGVQGNNWSRCPCGISADGRFVAFDSFSSNLDARDTDNEDDVYVRDRQAGTTEWISAHGPVDSHRVASGCPCAISGDGRYVVFASPIPFSTADTNGLPDMYLRDRQTGAIEQLNVASDETPGNHGVGIDVGDPTITADGRYVVFSSTDSNITPGDDVYACDNNFDGQAYENCSDAFLRDRQLGITDRVSVNNTGASAYGASWPGGVSADGRFVSFVFTGHNLAADTNQGEDVFVHDRMTGDTERVSVASDGSEGNSGGTCPCPLTPDGRYVAFHSYSSNLVPSDLNSEIDVFLHDRVSNKNAIVSMDSAGNQSTDWSFHASVTEDGRSVAFNSDAPLVAGDSELSRDVFVHQLADSDGDLQWEPFDNCPNWPNASQALPVWPVPANDPDCDGFSTTDENHVGTAATGHCGGNAWPADINNNGFSDITDLIALTGKFGEAVPPAPGRYNIAPAPPSNGFIDITDISRMSAFFGQRCGP